MNVDFITLYGPAYCALNGIYCLWIYELVGALLNKRPRTPPGTASGLDYQTADSENLLKRVRPPGPPAEEVSSFV